MPEDRVDKAQGGVTKVKGKYEKTDDNNETFYEQSVLGGRGYGREMPLDKAQNLYNLSDEDFERIYGKNKKSDTYRIEKGRREAVKEGNVTYTVEGKKGKDGKPFKYASGYRSKPGGEKTKEVEKPKETSTTTTTTTTPGNKDTGGNRRGNFLGNIPSLAEIAARASILGKGIEYSNIPENYLKLGRYKYASQLPTTLREIAQAEKEGREITRDIVGGNAASYLAQTGNLSASRMERAAKEITDDTIKRHLIELNPNVDLYNIEKQTNRALKDQYAAMRNEDRLKAKAAYNEELVRLGQRVDSATETAQEMANQKDIDGLLKLVPKTTTQTSTTTPEVKSKKGLKKVKTYKRR
jgi:hypothetical protein